jgi:hypothetical protein
MSRTDAEIIAALEEGGDIPWDQYFVAGNIDLIMFEHPIHGRGAKIIEDDELAAEIVAFLKRHGKVREI